MDLAPLFESFRVGSLELQNRFVMPAMQRGFAEHGVPNDDMARYYRRRIEGGVSLVIGEGTAINHPASTGFDSYARLTSDAVQGWQRVVEQVKAADGNMFLQLWHQGGYREAGTGPFPDAETVSPSGLALPGIRCGRAMTRQDMLEVTEAYVDAARIAKQIGFDGIEIHSAHGYLLDAFLWPQTNRREDEYGGSIANRTRFPCEIVRAVRDAVGRDFPISVRVSQWKTRAYDARNVETPEEWGELLGHFVNAGADVLHASARRFWVAEFQDSELGIAGWTKKLTGLPVIVVGSVGLDVDIMSSFDGQDARSTAQAGLGELMTRFNAGEFDLVAVGRALLGDPDWVKKVADGRFDELTAFTPDTLAYLE